MSELAIIFGLKVFLPPIKIHVFINADFDLVNTEK